MKKLLLSAAVFAAVATPAFAHNYSNDLVCVISDTGGNKLTYAFANNTHNSNGSFGGTYVETAFSKNGQDVVSPVGGRPIWYFGPSPNANYTAVISSRNAPGWHIGVAGNGFTNGYANYAAELWHDGRFIGRGGCARSAVNADGSMPAAAVGDITN